MKKLTLLAAAAGSLLVYSCGSDAGAGAWTQAQVDSMKTAIIDSVVNAKNLELEQKMEEFKASLMPTDSTAVKPEENKPGQPVAGNKGNKPSTNGKTQPSQPSQPSQPTKPDNKGTVTDRSGAKNSEGPKSVNDRSGAKNSSNNAPKSVNDRPGAK